MNHDRVKLVNKVAFGQVLCPEFVACLTYLLQQLVLRQVGRTVLQLGLDRIGDLLDIVCLRGLIRGLV